MRTPSRRSSSNRPWWPNCSSKKFRTLTTLAERPYDIPILTSRIVRYPSFTYPGTGGRRRGGGRSSSQTAKLDNSGSTVTGIPNDLLGNMSLIWAHKASHFNEFPYPSWYNSSFPLCNSGITLRISIWGGKKEKKFVYALGPIKKSGNTSRALMKATPHTVNLNIIENMILVT